MYDKNGIVPIEQKFLQPNYLFALRLQEGFLFGRVIDRSVLQYKPYDQLGLITPGSSTMTFPTALFPAGTNAISPDNSSKTDVLLASNLSPSDLHDVLYLPSEETSLLHGAIGVYPNWVRVYPRYPQNENYMGKWSSLNPPQPQNLDPFAYFDGTQSPYESPTDFRELVIPPKLHLSFVFASPGDYPPTIPRLNLLFAYYNCQFFNPNGRAYERKLISGIASRSIPADYLTMGAAERPLSYGKVMPVYKVNPIDLETAASLGGGQ
jgi:hypothetical protein